jgi:hypothetical protein
MTDLCCQLSARTPLATPATPAASPASTLSMRTRFADSDMPGFADSDMPGFADSEPFGFTDASSGALFFLFFVLFFLFFGVFHFVVHVRFLVFFFLLLGRVYSAHLCNDINYRMEVFFIVDCLGFM